MSNVPATKKRLDRCETKHLINLLSKFHKQDIITNLFVTLTEKLDDVTAKKKKILVIRKAIEVLTEIFHDLDELILFLHLRYILLQKTEINWNVLKIENAERLNKSNLTSKKVSDSIYKYFTKYNTKCKVLTQMDDLLLWIVFILEGNRSKPICCAVHENLSLVFIYNLKSDYLLLTEKVLRKTFKGSKIEQLTNFQSDAKYIQSLTTVSWGRFCKKVSSQDEKEKAFDNIKRRNKVINNSQEDINDSVAQSRRKRFKGNKIEECDKNSKPVIKNLSYKVWSSDSRRNKTDSLISFTVVKFQGTNILKGLDKLIESGIASAPLPDYLYNEPRSGKTEYIVKR